MYVIYIYICIDIDISSLHANIYLRIVKLLVQPVDDLALLIHLSTERVYYTLQLHACSNS